jgi:hypothetical protein
MSAVVKDKVLSARQVAADCYKECGGNEQRAMVMLRERIMTDPPLREEVLAPFVVTIVRDLIAECRRTVRSAIATPAARGSYGLKELARTWYDWPLANGVLLGDADKDLLHSESQKYELLSSTHKRRSNFFLKVSQKVPDGRKVRDVLSSGDIASIAGTCGVSQEAA